MTITRLFLLAATPCFFLSAGNKAIGQKVEFPLIVRNVIPDNTKEFMFTIAAHPDGSDSLDKDLGEVEIPSIPLPGDIFYVWTVAPISEPLWLSPKEIRKLRVGEKHLEVYDLRVNWTGGTLEITWPYPIPGHIDSIYVVDGKTDYPDNVLKVKVEPGTKLSTDNVAFDRFNVMVWYNAEGTDVAENETDSQIRLWPNPSEELLNISSTSMVGATVNVIDIQGRVIKTFTIASPFQTVATSNIPRGEYALQILGNSGRVITKHFVHL